jgi:hypothetical protein
MFGNTARARRGVVSVRAQQAVTRAVTTQLQRAGLGAIRSVAGEIAADLLGELLGQTTRMRKRGGAAVLHAIAGQALGGVGKALTWLTRGQKGIPNATPAEVRTAREIVAKTTNELPAPFQPPGTRRPEMEPAPAPSSTGRGRTPGGTGGGRMPPPDEPTDQPSGGDDGRGRTGIQMFRAVNSSNVHSYGYDVESATLYVRYLGIHLDRSKVKFKRNDPEGLQHIQVKKGAFGGRSAKPGPMYAYFGVPEKVFKRMHAAASKGIFIWDEIRVRGSIYKHKFNYRLVAAGVANIGRDASGRNETIMYVPRRATAKGFRAREITVASGQTILSNRSKTTSHRRIEMRRLRRIGF